MDIGITLEQWVGFLLIFFRISGILIFAPIFGNRSLPPQSKIGLALVLTIGMLPVLPMQVSGISISIFGLALAVLREALIGIVLGFVSQLLFIGVQFAGELISVQMGFSLATVMDPQFGGQSTAISQLQNLVAMLVFLAIDGHHWLLNGLAATFDVVPVGRFEYTGPVAESIFEMGGKLFVIAFQTGAPVMIALFLATLALGLVSRAVPQLNVFSVSFPIKIAVGFGALLMSLQLSGMVLQHLFQQMERDLQFVIHSMG